MLMLLLKVMIKGAVVCNGLYNDLEYENMHVESMVPPKANSLGVRIWIEKLKEWAVHHLKI